MEKMKFNVSGEAQSVRLQNILFAHGYDWQHYGYKGNPQWIDWETLYVDAEDMGIFTAVGEDEHKYVEMDTGCLINGLGFVPVNPVGHTISVDEAMDIMVAAGGTRVDNRVNIGEDIINKALGVNAPDILTDAADALINRAVERDHEDGSERSMERCVASFNAMRGYDLSVEDGWLFMVFLKLARSSNGAFRKDDYVDGAAYIALAGEEASK